MVDAAEVKLVLGAAEVFRNTPVNSLLKTCSRAASPYTMRNALRAMRLTCAGFWKRMVPTCCNRPRR